MWRDDSEFLPAKEKSIPFKGKSEIWSYVKENLVDGSESQLDKPVHHL